MTFIDAKLLHSGVGDGVYRRDERTCAAVRSVRINCRVRSCRRYIIDGRNPSILFAVIILLASSHHRR